jgi:malonyl-CoA O-methyltransferase
MLNPSDLDPKAVTQRFERLGQPNRRWRSLADGDFFLREVERRMLERLGWTKIAPARILDVGCGQGHGLTALKALFPEAQTIGLDSAGSMLQAATPALKVDRSLARFFKSKQPELFPGLVQGDSERLPFNSNSFDLIWSNLLFHWLPDAQPSVDEWHRVIRPGGLLSFTTLGVDTFKELREIGLPLMTLPDMHDIGDLLVKSGFAEPVMDQQKLVLTYSDEMKLIRELGALGGHVQKGRPKGLRADRDWRQTRQALNRLKQSDGKISVTTEIIFGHTWCPVQKRMADGWAPLEMRPYAHSRPR